MEEVDLKPLVSVIIPVYNSAEYLAESIMSCINQTWPNIEIIVIDDGSTDQSLSIARRYQNDRLRVYHQENKNASAARNSGLAKAKGDFIQFLDADDILGTDKIEKQVSLLMEKQDMVAVCSTVHFMDGSDYTESAPSAYEEAFLFDTDPYHFLINLYGGNSNGKGSMVQPNAWLCPRHVIEKAGLWNEDLTLDDDGEYFCRVLLCSAGVLKSAGYNYYRKYQQRKNMSALTEKKHLHSQYIALNQKISWLTRKDPSADLKKIHALWLNGLRFKAYPTDRQLVKQLNLDLGKLNTDYTPDYPFATPLGKMLCKIFGWKLTKLLHMLKHRLMKVGQFGDR